MRSFWGRTSTVVKNSVSNIINGHILLLTAGLSFYFVLSLFPLLIVVAALVGFLPIPNLFERIVDAMSTVVPADSMGLVRRIIEDVVTPNRGQFLTIGLLGTLWTASTAFTAVITALNIAYDAPETRPFWKTRLLAIGMMVVVGGLLIGAVAAMFVGPQFGGWVAAKVGLGAAFGQLWPAIRWAVAIAFSVLAVELILYWAPNVQQRYFWATLPGAVIGVVFWIGASYALGLYFQSFAEFNKTYGTLGAAVGLMVWLYWSWFMILVGAEVNAEILRTRGEKLPLKDEPETEDQARFAWEEEEVS